MQSQALVIRNLMELGLIEKEPVGKLGGSLAFFNEIVSIILMGFWGVLSDKLGRKSIYAFGFFMMALGMALFPFAIEISPSSAGE